MKRSGITTPALVLDRKILEENIATMNRILEGTSMRLRPHYKSHKCAALAKMQIANGAIGMTCAKLTEAEDLCDKIYLLDGDTVTDRLLITARGIGR